VITHPTAQELVAGVATWLPVDGSASGFGLRVARNALEIAARDMALSPTADARAVERMRVILGRDGTREQLDEALVAAIRAGDVASDDPRLIAHLKATALDTIAIDQPKYAHTLG
jgi:hypothetical protein